MVAGQQSNNGGRAMDRRWCLGGGFVKMAGWWFNKGDRVVV